MGIKRGEECEVRDGGPIHRYHEPVNTLGYHRLLCGRVTVGFAWRPGLGFDEKRKRCAICDSRWVPERDQ